MTSRFITHLLILLALAFTSGCGDPKIVKFDYANTALGTTPPHEPPASGTEASYEVAGFHENMRRMMNLGGGNFNTYEDLNAFMRNLSSGDMTVGEQLYWYNLYNDNFNRLSWQLD
jgi:hypothetical protein